VAKFFCIVHYGLKGIAQVVRNGCHWINNLSQAVHNHVFYFIIIFPMTPILAAKYRYMWWRFQAQWINTFISFAFQTASREVCLDQKNCLVKSNFLSRNWGKTVFLIWKWQKSCDVVIKLNWDSAETSEQLVFFIFKQKTGRSKNLLQDAREFYARIHWHSPTKCFPIIC